jgi:hypothetical protein
MKEKITMDDLNRLSKFAAAEVERITGPVRREFERVQAEVVKPFADCFERLQAEAARPIVEHLSQALPNLGLPAEVKR